MIKQLVFPLIIITSQCAFSLYSQINEGSTINSIYFSPDTSMVVLGSSSNTHNVYYFPNFTLAHAYTATNPCTCAKFSPNNLYIAFAHNNFKVVIKNTNNYTINVTINSLLSSIQQLDFSPDSTKLLLCGKNPSVAGYEIWDVQSPGALAFKSDYLYGKEGLACRFASDGSYAVGDIGGNTRYYSNSYSLQWKHTLTSSSPTVESLAFTSNGTVLAIGTGGHKKVYTFSNLLFNTTTNPVSRNDPIISLDFTEDGLFLASG